MIDHVRAGNHRTIVGQFFPARRRRRSLPAPILRLFDVAWSARQTFKAADPGGVPGANC